ncbi:MAG: hypothetical protein NTU93_00015 [Arthrobacter sp.]|nr:hypothetical protein [Arthrobacter sp.]
MTFTIVSVAAATAVLGYDIMQNTQLQQSANPRVLNGAGMRGSAAAGDTAVDLFIDTVKVATIYNTSTGVPNIDDIMPIDSLYIPPNALVHAYVTDAPATNPVFLALVLEEIEEP